MKTPRVPRTRNANTLTDAAFFGSLRSALRRHYRFWKPAALALEAASRPTQSANKRLKKEYQCADCKEWFKRDDVEKDHIIPCGSLRSLDDVASFIERLTPEDPAAFQILCKPHHLKKGAEDRAQKSRAR